jgi:hypothetical protein
MGDVPIFTNSWVYDMVLKPQCMCNACVSSSSFANYECNNTSAKKLCKHWVRCIIIYTNDLRGQFSHSYISEVN